MISSSLLTTLLLSLAVASTPTVIQDSLVTLPIAKRINANSKATILEHDQARAQELRRSHEGRQRDLNPRENVPAVNGVVDYTVKVQIGSPPTSYTLLVDTGSSNTWVGAGKPYRNTSTSAPTGQKVSVVYGSGYFDGDEYTDTVNLGSGLTIKNQSIGVASSTQGFKDLDGILGIGPVDLTSGTLIDDGSLIPTITDNLFSQHRIKSNLVSISLSPATSLSSIHGELTFGGIDSSKHKGPIHYAPITSTSSASAFWGIDQSIRYGSTTIQSTTAGIVDTGTTLVLLASDIFEQYQNHTGAVFDSKVGLLRLTKIQYKNLHSLYFHIHGIDFELTPNAQIWPRSLNSVIDGDPDSIYSIIGNLGSNSGQGFDFVNGMTFLERYYSVYDTTNRRVGLATTSNTFAETN
ncbi:peptidase A1 family protein [Abortiporus biennis]